MSRCYVSKVLQYRGLVTLTDQENALKHPKLAYLFARDIPGADIERCQEAACKDPRLAYKFALYIFNANIEKCQEAACRDPVWAFYFAIDIKNSDIKMSLEACKGTKYEAELNEYLMDKALL